MTEKIMLAKLISLFDRNRAGRVVPIESGGTKNGIPDVYYEMPNEINGWIELKETVQQTCGKIVIPYRPGQRSFLLKSVRNKIKAFVLLWVDDEYYLINSNFEKLCYKNRDDLLEYCVWHSEKPNKMLLEVLK